MHSSNIYNTNIPTMHFECQFNVIANNSDFTCHLSVTVLADVDEIWPLKRHFIQTNEQIDSGQEQVYVQTTVFAKQNFPNATGQFAKFYHSQRPTWPDSAVPYL